MQRSDGTRPRPAAVRGLSGPWLLSAGLTGVLILIAGVAGMSALQIRRVELADAVVDRQAERSAYLVGNVGELITLLWAETLDTTTESGRTLTPIVAAMVQQRALLDSELAELPGLLAPGESMRAWQVADADIRNFRATLDHALQLRIDDHPDDAEALLDAAETEHEHVSRDLGRLELATHRSSTGALSRSEDDMASVRMAQVLSFVALFIATLAIGVSLVVLMRRQRRQTAAHLELVENANRDLEAFAGRVAHDLKNIVAPIGLSTPLLLRPGATPEARAAAAGRIDRATRRTVDVLEGLLAFARAGARRGDGERASPSAELDGVLEDLAPQIERIQPSLELDVDPGLTVACSPALVHVVVANLVGNALKFLDGRPERRLRITARAAAGVCRLEVDDSGPGIAPAVREHVFEPFYRGPGVTVGGAGIGLATVRRVVEAYGGSASVTSVEDRGSTFTVTLPLAPPPSARADDVALLTPPNGRARPLAR